MDASAHSIVTHRHTPPKAYGQRAYSLFDALTTLAVLSTVTTVAIPAASHMITSTRVTTQVNELMTHLHLARSEAIKRGQRVLLCKSRDGSRCTGDSLWHEGWIVFVDQNDNHNVDADEQIIRVQQALTGVTLQARLSGGSSHVNNYVGYRPDGFSGKGGTFTFCVPDAPAQARGIILYWTGRPRISRMSAEGEALPCTATAS